MSIERMSQKNSEDRLLNLGELYSFLEYLVDYVGKVMSMGGNDVEKEAINMINHIQRGGQVAEEQKNNLLGILGNPFDKNTNYH